MRYRDHPYPGPGEVIESQHLRLMAETCNWVSRLSVAPPLELQDFGGPMIRLATTANMGAFYCNPSASIMGASGTWAGGGAPSSYTPGSTSADVYQDQNGKLVKIESGAKIQNWYPAATVAGHVINVISNGYGAWDVVAQSCS